MIEPLSHVDYLAQNVQALLNERFDGRVTRLGKDAHMNPNAIRRILAGKPCRLQTVDKLAQACGMAVGEMFLKPGISASLTFGENFSVEASQGKDLGTAV